MKRFAILASILPLAISSTAMAESGFLVAKPAKGGEIQGESGVQGFAGQITINSFDFESEFKYPNAAANKFNRPSPVVTFKMPYSKAVPLFLGAASTGEVFSEFKFSAARNSGQGKFVFAVYTFKNVHINGIAISHSSNGEAEAEISILYQSLSINYTPQDKTGKAGTGIAASDNVVQ